jgi:transmembrane sensor
MKPSMDSEAIEEAAARWFAKQKGDHWSELDQVQLDQWLQASTANRIAFIRIDTAWQHSARLKALGAGIPPGVIPPRNSWGFAGMAPTVVPASGVSALPEIQEETPDAGTVILPVEAPRRRFIPAAIAAMFTLPLIVGIAWHFLASDGKSYRTQIGKTNTIPLSDGSRVTLNTDTQIHVALDKSARHVELYKGEAFFKVAKDSNRPFIVSVGNKRIIAVGTAFSVRRDNDDVRVVVIEGRVRLERIGQEGAAPVTQLDAGAEARTAQSGVLVEKHPLSEAEQALSWRSGYVTFQDTALSDAIAEFNRYNARKIVIEDPRIATIHIGGNFRSDNADAFLWLLQSGFPIKVEQHEDRVVLKGS